MNELTPRQRAIRVLASQGKAPGKLTGMTTDEVVVVAAMCSSDGDLVPDVRIRFADWLANRCNGCDEEE